MADPSPAVHIEVAERLNKDDLGLQKSASCTARTRSGRVGSKNRYATQLARTYIYIHSRCFRAYYKTLSEIGPELMASGVSREAVGISPDTLAS